MTQLQKRNFCTDANWLGRSDCKHCSVRHLMLFSGLPGSAFDEHLAPVEHFIFPAASTLFTEGRDDGAVFSIRRGIVKLLSLTSDGNQRIVRLLGPGMAVGLELLKTGSNYQHTAVAVTELDTCRIPVATIDELEQQFPELCTQIRQRLQDQLNRADEWIVELGTGTARKRIAHLMLMMMEFAAEPGGEIPQLSGTDIGAIIGSSPETVSRIIADMKRNGILEKTNGLYRGNTPALEAILETDC